MWLSRKFSQIPVSGNPVSQDLARHTDARKLGAQSEELLSRIATEAI